MALPQLAYTAAEAAELLRVSEWTVRRLVHEGDLAKIPHMGDRIVIAGIELERFAAQGLKAAS